MPDLPISSLPAATTPLAGTEVLAVVQSGVTRQVAVSQLGGGLNQAGAGTFNEAGAGANGGGEVTARTIDLLGVGTFFLGRDEVAIGTNPSLAGDGNGFLGALGQFGGNGTVSISSDSAGCVAIGASNNGDFIFTNGFIGGGCIGCVAIGYAVTDFRFGTAGVDGPRGAFAGGAALTAEIAVEANGAFQWAEGVNAVANSLQVGTTSSGIRLHADGLPAAPANGDVFNVAGDVFIRSGGVSVQIQVAAVGLNKSGAGTFLEGGTGANVGGNIPGAGSTISGAGNGSLTVMDNGASGVTVTNNSSGGVLTGGVFAGSVGTVTVAGSQSWMHASLFVPSGTADISINADFGWLHGRTSGDSQLQVNQDAASILYGFAGGGATVTLSGASHAILHSNNSDLDIDGFMNFAVGFLDGAATASTLRILSPAQPNETTSTILIGHSSAGGDVTVGDASVQMIGGGLIGAAVGVGAIIRSTRSGAFAFGHAATGEVIDASAVNATQFAEGSNSVANSLQVGAAGTGIHLHAAGLPASPDDGDLWVASTDLSAHSGGQDRNLSDLPITNTVTTTDATVTTIATIPITDDTINLIEAHIVGRRTDAADRAAYIRIALVFREAAGSATLEGTVNTQFTRESSAAFDATIVVSANNALVQVTGEVAKTINWECKHTEKAVA